MQVVGVFFAQGQRHAPGIRQLAGEQVSAQRQQAQVPVGGLGRKPLPDHFQRSLLLPQFHVQLGQAFEHRGVVGGFVVKQLHSLKQLAAAALAAKLEDQFAENHLEGVEAVALDVELCQVDLDRRVLRRHLLHAHQEFLGLLTPAQASQHLDTLFVGAEGVPHQPLLDVHLPHVLVQGGVLRVDAQGLFIDGDGLEVETLVRIGLGHVGALGDRLGLLAGAAVQVQQLESGADVARVQGKQFLVLGDRLEKLSLLGEAQGGAGDLFPVDGHLGSRVLRRPPPAQHRWWRLAVGRGRTRQQAGPS